MKIEPETTDGRNVDPRIGALGGEAARLRVERPEPPSRLPELARAGAAPAIEPEPREEVPTYYGLPAIKAPPWKWYIPAYLYTGGAAGAAAALATAAQLSGRAELDALIRKGRWIAAAGDAASAALLIADLGKPERFLNMLRVFRPSSPMNVGTWLLTASGMTSALEVARELWRRGPRPRFTAIGSLSGLGGLSLTTYTAVLLSNTAVPLWSRGHRRLPLLFAAAAAASAASLLELTAPSRAESRVVRSFGGIAKATELAAMGAFEADLDRRVSAPLRRGRSGTLWRAAMGLGAASLAATLWPGGGWKRGLVAGALGTAGAVAMRFAVIEAGKQSANDPRATFEPQRRTAAARRGPRARTPEPAATPTHEETRHAR